MKTKEYLKSEGLIIVIILLPFIIIPLFWNKIPEQVPMHWNIHNEVDSYGSKGVGLFILPIMNFVFYFLFLVIPKIDPRKTNIALFKSTYKALRLGIHLFFVAISTLIVLASMGENIDIGKIIFLLVTLLFLFIGYMMSNIKSNYFIGIRTPWTLQNDEVWKRTHKMAGKVWIYGSVAMFLIGLFVEATIMIFIFFGYVAVLVLVPVIYSYIIYKKIEREGGNGNNPIDGTRID
jgi:uncharacterized membrane protein